MEVERLDEFVEEVVMESKRSTSVHEGVRRRSVSSQNVGKNSLQFLQKEDNNFKKGVDTTHEILKDVKLMNMKLDDISGLVKLQRQKLLNMQDKIKESQNVMARSKKLLKTFSKEIYGDKIIMVFGILIALVLVFIGIAAIKYKFKAQELVLTDEELLENDDNYNEIDESIFFKRDLVEEANRKFEKAKETLGQLMANKFLQIQEKVKKERAEKNANGENLGELHKLSSIKDSLRASDNVWSKGSTKLKFQNEADAKGFMKDFNKTGNKIEKRKQNLERENTKKPQLLL